MAPVIFVCHIGCAWDRDWLVLFFRSVFCDLSRVFFIELVNLVRNERCRKRNSSNLSAKKVLLSFENERISVYFLFQVSSELALSSSGGVDVISMEIWEHSPVTGLGCVSDPVTKSVNTSTTGFLILNRLRLLSSFGSSFSHIIVCFSSSDLTPETHVSGRGLLSKRSE